MKKLKKIVALVMTVAMLAGLFVFAGPTAGAAAEVDRAPHVYSDHDDINEAYEIAIQIFTKMRVIEGTDNNLRPNSGLSRAEAATIITRALISREAATSLGSTASPFTDVPASHWASGAVAFARNRGLISGVGSGMFAPNGQLTKAQWIRILLSSIGYGANNEFTGSGWAARAYETASNVNVDLFGNHNAAKPRWPINEGYPPAIPPTRTSPWDRRMNVPTGGLNDPIPREEAVALLFNAVLFVTKVEYDRAADIYRAVNTGSAGLGGYNTDYICHDIGLSGPDTLDRDRYGRPVARYNNWVYRSVNIYRHPLELPEMVAEYTRNETGTQIRTALQGTLDDALQLDSDGVRIFANGGAGAFTRGLVQGTAQPDETIFTHNTPTSIPSTHSSMITQGQKDAAVAAGDATLTSFYNANYSSTGTLASASSIFESYLALAANGVAFGPATTVQVYRHADLSVDVVIVAQYLNRLMRKVADDTRTLLVYEKALEFDLYQATGVTRQIAERPIIDPNRAPEMRNLNNFEDLFDNATVGSYYITTPRGAITPAGFVPGMGGGRNALQNEVYEAARTVTGSISTSSATRITVAGTPYNLALNPATVNIADFSNNYRFYLDENETIIGAVYAAPGESTMVEGYLFLHAASGSSMQNIHQPAVARADVTLGSGTRRMVDLRIRINPSEQYWDPNANNLRGDWAALPGSETPLSITTGFYGYTVSGGVYTLLALDMDTSKDGNFRYLSNGTLITIGRGIPRVDGGQGIVATNRTILTMITSAGRRVVADVNAFPNITPNSSNAVALVRLEPGSQTRAAEILYVDTGAPAASMTHYGYLIGVSQTGPTQTGTFIINATSNLERQFRIALGGTTTLEIGNFYMLEETDDNDWRATKLEVFVSGTQTSLQSGYLDASYLFDKFFGLRSERTVPEADMYFEYADLATRMNIISMDDAFGDNFSFVGTNDAIGTLENNRLVVVIYGEDGTAGMRALAAFVFGHQVDRNDVAGLR